MTTSNNTRLSADAAAEAIDSRIREHGLALSWEAGEDGVTLECGAASVFVTPR